MQDEFSEQLQQQKLDAMKELAYGASHEINNPLANIAARAQTLLRDEGLPERRRALEAIHQQAMRAHEMIADLMLFARPPKLEIQAVDLAELVQNVLAGFEDEFDRRNICSVLNVPSSPCEINCDRKQLSVAIAALIRNSAEALGNCGTLTTTLSQNSEKPGFDGVEIEVADTGPGISAEIREHMFDPFFSGREAGRGLGFGLSKCWRIVTEHGGLVAVCDSPGQGAKISMVLPKG